MNLPANSPAPCACAPLPAFTPARADGFHGVWYGYTDGTYYAGGLGTFPQQIHPMAYHAAAAGERGRTFFVWGGAKAGVKGAMEPLTIQATLQTYRYMDERAGASAPKPGAAKPGAAKK